MTRRIIVALDEGAASMSALQSAARLAAETSAEILALFIEDIDLLSVAAFPEHSVVSTQGELLSLDEGAVLRALRVRARHLREQVESIATHYAIAWQFQVARGRVREEILTRAQSCEMIAIGASSLHRRGLGRNAGAILAGASCSVVVFNDRARVPTRIAVLSPNSRTRVMAAQLARASGVSTFDEVELSNPRHAFDRLMRLAPSHLVSDRGALASIGVSAQDLVIALDLEALVVAGAAGP